MKMQRKQTKTTYYFYVIFHTKFREQAMSYFSLLIFLRYVFPNMNLARYLIIWITNFLTDDRFINYVKGSHHLFLNILKVKIFFRISQKIETFSDINPVIKFSREFVTCMLPASLIFFVTFVYSTSKTFWSLIMHAELKFHSYLLPIEQCITYKDYFS